MKKLKEKLDKKQLLLTVSVKSSKEYISKAFNYPAIAKYFDFIHFQLSFRGDYNWESEIQARNIHDLEYVIVESIKLGVPSTKFLIEINFGGFVIQYEGKYSSPQSFYPENSDKICFEILFNNCDIYDYGYGWATDEEGYHTFHLESSRVIANKIRFAVRNDLAGALNSGVDLDDHQNRCERIDIHTYDDYSLVSGVNLNIPKRTGRKPFFVNILNEAIIVALDGIDQETKIMTKNRLIYALGAVDSSTTKEKNFIRKKIEMTLWLTG